MVFITEQEILETVSMIRSENLDVRAVTMGISLTDCAGRDPHGVAERVHAKIVQRAGRLVGVAAIRSAFDAMFSKGSIRAWPESVHRIESLVSSVHNVRERIEVLTDEGPRLVYVIATNVYHKTAQGWRMVAHHASPGADQEPQEVTPTPHLLH